MHTLTYLQAKQMEKGSNILKKYQTPPNVMENMAASYSLKGH